MAAVGYKHLSARASVQLPHKHSAIDLENMASDVPRLFRSKKTDSVSYVHIAAGATKGNHLVDFGFQVAGECLGHRRLDIAWRHCVDGNAPGAHLPGHSLSEPDYPAFDPSLVRLPRLAT